MKISRSLRLAGIAALTCLVSLSITPFASAGSATWNLDPATDKWTTATNWTPATVPNGPADTATFATSNTANVTLPGSIEVSSIVFNSGASAFTLTVSLNQNLALSGAGVTNDSGIVQQFVCPTTPHFRSAGSLLATAPRRAN